MDDEIRSLEQNKKLHAAIRDVSQQVKWGGDYMSEEAWKVVFMGAAYGQTPVENPFDPHAPPVVVNNRRSSGLVKPEMADVITMIEAFGSERGVQWTDEKAAA